MKSKTQSIRKDHNAARFLQKRCHPLIARREDTGSVPAGLRLLFLAFEAAHIGLITVFIV